MNAPKTLFPIHARTVTGLEGVLAQELATLGAQKIEPRSRLVTCVGDLSVLYAANLWCRTAIRVLRPLTQFPARNEKELYQGVGKVAWEAWMSTSGTLAVDANVRSSFTTHSLFIAQLAKDAIVDRFRENTGRRPSVDLERPDLRVAVSLFQDVATLYVDASGESLHKRGYRKKAGDAPVSETLAAGILKLTGWDGKTPLLDPMCGSGTFAIEAGLMVRNVAPGLFRNEFGFQRWSDFDGSLWARLLDDAKRAVKRDVKAPIFAADMDPAMIAIARENIARAALGDLIRTDTGDFFERNDTPKTPGTLVMNPPYDERLPVDNVAELYQKIGDRLKRHFGGWKAYVLAGNLEAVKYVGLKSSRRIPLFNGSLECRLLEYELRALDPNAPAADAPVWRKQIAPSAENPLWKAKAETFANRLRKSLKRESPWAKRAGVTCWRIYDWDVPELPFVVDIYGDRIHFAEIQRNHDHSPTEHSRYQELMVRTAAEVLGIEKGKAYFKVRKPQQAGGFQYTAHAQTNEFIEVAEGGHKFLVNLADYLDVGLFLDHRKTRAMVEKESKGKDFLNLFAYTGSFTVYAAAGGAKTTTTVDTSGPYLEWAEENLRINDLLTNQHTFVRMDSFEFLERTQQTFDLVVVDPPTRSVNRSSGRSFEMQEDHVRLLQLVLDRTRTGGTVFFSTNYRTFELDEAALTQGRSLAVKEITSLTVPPDFQRKHSHRCWRIQRLR